MKKRLLSLVLVMSLVATTVLAGCSGTSSSTVTNKDEINVCIASEPASLDPALNSAVDGGTMLAHLFSGLAKWTQDEDGNVKVVADAAEELVDGVENADGTVTYTYTLRDGLTWSDGVAVTAYDFEFAWNRAASVSLAADYCYMFDVIDGYNDIWADDATGDEKLNVVATDDRTLVVTLYNAVPYWNELLAFPTYYPVREDVVSNESWATDPSTYVSNGAYTMTSWSHNSVITLTKNENYVDADEITMQTINFYLSDDANNMLTNFQNGSWQFIDDVPTNEIATLKSSYADEFVVAGHLGTYYVCWNINEDILPASSTLTGTEKVEAESEIRNAISLLLDRNYIVEQIAQGGQVPASSFVAMGIKEADGSEFYENAGDSDDYIGYFDTDSSAYTDNWNTAIEVLKKYYTYDESTGKFTDVPTMTYLYNTSEGHKAIGEYIQSALAGIGITLQLENQEWATFLSTRKSGDYTIARNGWLADYNDPITFLDTWTTSSGNNDVQFGKGDHASVAAYSLDLTSYGYDINVTDGTWAETYDVLISTIKSCTDDTTRYELMHLAEDMLMETGCITPLYFYTDLYMVSDQVEGFFSTPLGFKYFMYTTYAD